MCHSAQPHSQPSSENRVSLSVRSLTTLILTICSALAHRKENESDEDEGDEAKEEETKNAK